MKKNDLIRFFYQDVQFNFKSRTVLKQFIVQLFRKENHQLNCLNIIFCTDEALLQMNRRFLKHNYYTDIITFPLSAAHKPIEAELYISIDRVRDNAKNINKRFTQELHRVIFHGCLHLCGYNDQSKKEILVMREKEEEYLAVFQQKQNLM